MNIDLVRRWVASRRRVELVLVIYVIGLMFSNYYPLVLTAGNTRILRPDWLLFVPLFVYVVYSAVTSTDYFDTVSRGSYLAIGSFVVFTVSAVINQLYSPFDAFTVLGQLLYTVTLFCCVAYLRIDRQTLRTVFQFLIFLMIIMSFYVVYQAIALNHGLPFWNPYFDSLGTPTRTLFETHGYSRPAGFMAEPRWLAAFYLPGIAFLMGTLTNGSNLFGNRRVDLVVLGIVLLAVALAGSMAGYISLTALFVFGILLPWTRRGMLGIAVGFYASMAILVAVLSVFGSGFATMILSRVTKILDILLGIGLNLTDLVVPDDEDGYQHQYLDGDDWQVTESTLTARDGEYFLHLGFRRHPTDTERDTAEDGTVLGVDLGIENLAVTSTACFISGRELTHNLRTFEKVRASLQQTGTRSAHRTLVRSSKRDLQYIRDVLHNASNAIVEEALRYDCDVIAFENLTHIRHRTRASWGHRWAFRTVSEQVGYKAEAAGITVKQVPPQNTSKRCVECGFTADKNRPTRNEFCCEHCGTEANADYNAAKNIGLRYVRRGQQSSRRTGNSQLALKSGTVTPSGGFTAHPDGFEAEDTDKPHPQRAKSSD